MRRTEGVAWSCGTSDRELGPTVLCLEAMSSAEHAAVVQQIGVGSRSGGYAALLLGDVPIVEASPQQIKQVLCGLQGRLEGGGAGRGNSSGSGRESRRDDFGPNQEETSRAPRRRTRRYRRLPRFRGGADGKEDGELVRICEFTSCFSLHD